MRTGTWVVLGAFVAELTAPRVAEACGGGGIVSARPGSVGADTQRVVISVFDGSNGGGPTATDVVVQISVPSTTEDYGALLPVPSEPMLDATPVSAEELDQLDAATAPQIYVLSESEDDGGSGCACFPTYGGDSMGPVKRGAQPSEPVNIGPVTAVVISGEPAAVSTWLGENGFAVSAANDAMLAEYSDGYFVAIRRNEAVTGGPTSIGVHFKMAGDHRELPLRFASLGAAPTVAFTLFIFANDNVGPSTPFVPLTLDDLDPALLRTGTYAGAVNDAVQRHGGQAFVVESRTPRTELATLAGTRLETFFTAPTVTRFSTVLPAEALTEDAHFYTPFEGDVPDERYVRNSTTTTSRHAGAGSLAALLLAGLWRRRRPRQRA